MPLVARMALLLPFLQKLLHVLASCAGFLGCKVYNGISALPSDQRPQVFLLDYDKDILTQNVSKLYVRLACVQPMLRALRSR